jgi:hypothetical protein
MNRHDKPVEKVVPQGQRHDPEVQTACDELLAIRQELRKRPGYRLLTSREIRKAIEFGRK